MCITLTISSGPPITFPPLPPTQHSSAMPTRILTQKDAVRCLSKYNCIVFDLDGVVWTHQYPTPGVHDAFAALKRRGVMMFYVTNFAQPRVKIQEKFQKLGLGEYAPLENITTSASAVASLLSKDFRGKKVYLIGEPGLADELHLQGIESVGTTRESNVDGLKPPTDSHRMVTEMQNGGIDKDVAAVVVGADYHLNYRKLVTACAYVQRGCPFYACNPDVSSPTPIPGIRFPGTGSVAIAPIVAACGVQPIIAAKPNPEPLNAVIAAHKLDRSRVLMVGDRLDTDVEFGNAAGVDSMLVLSGNGTAADAEQATGLNRPKFVADSVAIFAQVKPEGARL